MPDQAQISHLLLLHQQTVRHWRECQRKRDRCVWASRLASGPVWCFTDLLGLFVDLQLEPAPGIQGFAAEKACWYQSDIEMVWEACAALQLVAFLRLCSRCGLVRHM